MTAHCRLMWLRLLCCLAAVGPLGCAAWSPEAKPPSQLPSPRMSPDSVVLEIARLSTPAPQTPALELIWNEADELQVPPDLQARLAAHGFRCGVLGPTLPESLLQLMDEKLSSLDAADGVRMQRRLLQSRRDHPTLEPVGGQREHVEALLVDHQSLRGESFVNAQAAGEIRTQPQGDGSVLVQVTPLLQFGEMKNRRVVEDGVWRYEVAPDQRTWDEFRMTARLTPGQTLLIGATPDARSLGGQFFAHPADQGRRALLLIRLAQSQRDDLFSAPTTQ